MKLKDALIGAMASLTVTVIGGIAVYYLTGANENKQEEKLVYSSQQSASFSGNNNDISFVVITITNAGNISARNVEFSAGFANAKIKDYSFKTAASAKEISREFKQNNIKFGYDILLPGEVIELNLLTTASEPPTITLRSDASMGVNKTSLVSVTKESSLLSRILELLVPITGVLLGVLAALLLYIARRNGTPEALFSDKNNAGFLLLHHGFFEDANKVLTDALHAGRYDAFTLSNLALCKQLMGEHQQALLLIKAANFRERHGHAKAIILFNESIISLLSGDKNSFIDKLRQAAKISPREIKDYLGFSIHVDQMRNDANFIDVVNNA